MTMLASYDHAMTALAEALKSTSIDMVKASRIEIEFIKLHAKRIQDREVLAVATEYQMRIDRWLGTLLQMAEDAGDLAVKGGQRKLAEGAQKPATLKEIGIKPKLSMTAKWAASMESEAFEIIVAEARDRIRSGSAVLVDPIQNACKAAEQDKRRADHAARTMNGGRVEDLHKLSADGYRASFIGMDPQWHFKTRSAAGEGRSAGVHYNTEAIEKIKNIPVESVAADNCALGMWTVDWCLEAAFELMRHFGFEPVTKLYTWVKTNGEGELLAYDDSTWHMGMGYWSRANPEDCWLGTRGDPKRLYADVRQLIVAPLMEHSRKPDAWLERSERLVEGPYLELNARRTRPGWVSWGDELEFTGVAA